MPLSNRTVPTTDERARALARSFHRELGAVTDVHHDAALLLLQQSTLSATEREHLEELLTLVMSVALLAHNALCAAAGIST